MRNTVEVVTGICTSVAEAVADLRETLGVVVPAADALGVDLLGSGTHPFASWSAQQLTEGARYEELINRTQWWGRQMLIWGVHVHVGLPSQDRVMPIMSSLLDTYPHLLALSASSPVWAGLDTGYASNRSQMFQQLPTAGLPFTFDTWEEFEDCIADQATTGVIDSMSDVRWDIRPAPHLGTIENRVCDGMSDINELAALTALIHCLVVDLDTRLAAGETLPTMPPWHVQENKWRAARYGLDAIVILDDEVARAARHRRPRRPARAAHPGRRSGSTARTSCARSPTSPATARPTSASARSPRPAAATWSRSSTRSSPSSARRSSRGSAARDAAGRVSGVVVDQRRLGFDTAAGAPAPTSGGAPASGPWWRPLDQPGSVSPRGGGIASVDSSWPIPVSISRSVTTARSWASITSTDSASSRGSSEVAIPTAIRAGCAATAIRSACSSSATRSTAAASSRATSG